MAPILLINDWKLCKELQDLVFDTTASDTSLLKEACTKIEKVLGRDLFWIACRHYILKNIFSCVFNILLGPTSNLKRGLFERFKEQ